MMMTHLDIIVLLLLVVVIFQRLKGLLGTKPEQEHRIKLSKESAEKLYDILMKETQQTQAADGTEGNEEAEELKPIGEELSGTDKVLAEIPGFDKEQFLQAAQNAFQIITEAFNKGDTETLEMLVNKNIFKKFQNVIEQRLKDKMTAETDFICFDDVEILNAEIDDNKVAKIAVKYLSEQVNVLRDADGNVIEGDENYIQNIEDVWTFERAINSTTPNWILISTKKTHD